uniref:PDZ domain-containing protein n=1 Tax=Setaria digitata TaxID=48799 RepID=A0A915PYI8_9BILA
MSDVSEEEDVFDEEVASVLVPPTYRITVQIDYEEGEPFGIEFGKNLTVLGVKKDMRADGILYPGDVIISINDVVVEDQVQFYDLIKRLFPMVKIEVERKLWRTPLTDVRARQIGLITKKHHEYFIAYLHRIDGMKLGLSVRQIHNQVVVSKCKVGSIVSKCYQEGDHILDVDGVRVYSKADAKERIIAGLRSASCVSTVVERKELEEQSSLSNRMLLLIGDRNPKMAPDAVKIGQREAARIRACAGKQFPLKSILRTSSHKSSTTLQSKFKFYKKFKIDEFPQFDMKPLIMRVASDTKEPNRLMHVKKKEPNRGFLNLLFGKRTYVGNKRRDFG